MKINEYDYGPIGARIKKSRLAKNYTQEYLAEIIDVTAQHISDIERGLHGISISALISICQTLEVDADYILFGTISRSKTPINTLITKMTPQQSLYAEEILQAYAKSCGIKN